MGKPALADAVAPAEDDSVKLVDDTTILFGFDYCHYVVKALEGGTAATSLLYECNDLEDDEVNIEDIPLQELDKDSDDDLDGNSTNASTTNAASTVDGSPQTEINLQTLFPEEVNVNNLTDLLDLGSNDDVLNFSFTPRASPQQQHSSPTFNTTI